MTGAAGSKPFYGLAIETSSALGSVALGIGDQVLEARVLSGERRHAVEFLPAVAAICSAHGVEPLSLRIIYVSSGPGSFTGLRIAVTAARMMGLAGGAALVSVPTLEIIAQNALDAVAPPDHVLVMLDAKRGRIYAAAFLLRDERYVAATDSVETDPGEFLAARSTRRGTCAVLGEGVIYHRAAVEASGLDMLPDSYYRPRAEITYALGLRRANEGKLEARRSLVPFYIRPPEAEERWEQRIETSKRQRERNQLGRQ